MTTNREHAENVALWESLAPAPVRGQSWDEMRAEEAAEAEAEARRDAAAQDDPFNGDRFATW